MKRTILIFILFLFFKNAFSTGQVPDYLIINNDTLAIFSNPLEQYFEKVGNRELIDFLGCGSTACWRGYKAIWELKNDTLYLRKITSCHNNCGLDISDANLKRMFGSDKVVADWFTGTILVPKGKLIHYVHMAYASIYEEEHYYSFENGIHTKTKIKSNKKIANKKRRQDKEREITILVQDTLFYYVKNNINWDTLVTPWYMLPSEKYFLTYNKRGKIKKVKVDYEGVTFREKIDDWWWNIVDDRQSRIAIKKAIKPLRLSYLDLPNRKFIVEFEIFYYHKTGKLELWKPDWMEDYE